MPAVRRIPKYRREELTPCQRGHLLTGWFAVGLAGTQSRYKTLAEFEAAWNEFRDELLPEFIARHPGKRPAAWWIVDHRRERPLNAEGQAMAARFGIERLRSGDRFRETFGHLHCDLWQVPQADYLRAHGLLTLDEIEE